MARRGMSQAVMLAALVMSMADGLGDGIPEAPTAKRDDVLRRRKKWQKGPSAGPGGPVVRL